MSVFLAKRVKNIVPNIDILDVDYSTEINLKCDIHGSYIKTVTQILYKNPNCPECTRLDKNKRLSEIGKTKTGEKNSFYGHKHSEETLKKLSKPLSEERKRKISDTVKSKECQERIKQTNLKLYGNENYRNIDKAKKTFVEKYNGIGAASPIIRNNMENTCKAKYGVDTYWKSDDFRQKSKETMINRYGVDNVFKMPENQQKARKAYTGRINTYEQQLIDICKSCNIDIKIHDRTLLNEELDIYIPALNIGIEFNGNYWHSYPRKPHDYHLNKSINCKKIGVRLIHIYEFEDFEEQKRLLKNLLLGTDNYPKNDFNKNNLINDIPNIIPHYITNKGDVYTAGLLY